MKIEEEDPFGIKNEQLRAIVKAKFERGENFHYRWVPLECIRQVDRLRGVVMKGAKDIRCPTLVIHAREDELTSLRSANFLVEQIGGARARMVVLEDSYHMICVDNDREIVAKNVLEFFGAALPGATSALANEPKMTREALARGGGRRHGEARRRRLRGTARDRHPRPRLGAAGANSVSGAHAGKTFASFASRIAQGGAPRFTAFGTPVFNRGVALRAGDAGGAAGRRARSNRRVRCCSHFTAASCSRCAGSPTTSSARTRSSARPNPRCAGAATLDNGLRCGGGRVQDAAEARRTTTRCSRCTRCSSRRRSVTSAASGPECST